MTKQRILTGGCHCGEVRYVLTGEAKTHALCHCSDCRKSAGAPYVAWAMFNEDQVTITKGQTKTYASSLHVRREFCAACGTGLLYKNAPILPHIIDVQTGTLDEPDLLPALCHIQTAERVSWVKEAHKLPEFERYPPIND
jgi:hypothetical protein